MIINTSCYLNTFVFWFFVIFECSLLSITHKIALISFKKWAWYSKISSFTCFFRTNRPHTHLFSHFFNSIQLKLNAIMFDVCFHLRVTYDYHLSCPFVDHKLTFSFTKNFLLVSKCRIALAKCWFLFHRQTHMSDAILSIDFNVIRLLLLNLE
jgi:hypothetical protein